MGRNDGIHQRVPDACFPPSVEAVVDRCQRPVMLRQISPRRARVTGARASGLVRERRLNGIEALV